MRMTLREHGGWETGKEWVLDLACGRCGIVQHPMMHTGTVKECPIGGCHVCCQGGSGRSCNPVDGKAFFKALYDELVEHDNPFQRIDPWNDWLDQLETGVVEVRQQQKY
ncbi:unnamed protein product [Heterosigma akashiwo]